VKPLPSVWMSTLERQFRDGYPWLRFSPELETQFRIDYLEGIVTRRLILLGAGLFLIAITPLLDLWVTHPPEPFIAPARWSQFGVMIPALLVGGAFTALPRLRRWADPVAAIVAYIVSCGLLYQRYVGVRYNFHVPVELVGVLLVGTAVLAGLRVLYFAPLVIAIVITFAFNEFASVGATPSGLYTIAALGMMAAITSVGAWMEERSARSAWLQRKLLEEMAARDSLSGLANARAFREAYPRLHAVAARSHRSLLVAVVDIDYFKNYNDHYGHLAGDDTLRRIAQVLARHGRRATDIQARTGGEEFALVWYDVGEASCTQLLEALRTDVESLRIPHAAAPSGPGVVTISIGAAWAQPQSEDPPDALLQTADEQMYQSKQLGRNRVSFRHAERPAPPHANVTRLNP
jgi:diguanylate cyclase (GGDEF)-like protein